MGFCEGFFIYFFSIREWQKMIAMEKKKIEHGQPCLIDRSSLQIGDAIRQS